jgi:hypothetical protein
MTFVCKRCGGVGWLEVDSRGQGTFQPCGVCQPDVYNAWASGEFMPKWSGPLGRHEPIDPEVAKLRFDELRRQLAGEAE